MKTIIPFSNGTEAMYWQENNCDQCKRRYKPGKGENEFPDFDATEKLVKQGRECKLKFAVDYGFVTGEISEDAALQIGMNGHKLKESCMMFIEDSGRGWEGDEPPKPIIHIPDNQLCLPFEMNEIIGVKDLIEETETKT